MAVGVLTHSTVGMCQVEGPYVFIFFSVANLLIIDSFRLFANYSTAPVNLRQHHHLYDLKAPHFTAFHVGSV